MKTFEMTRRGFLGTLAAVATTAAVSRQSDTDAAHCSPTDVPETEPIDGKGWREVYHEWAGHDVTTVCSCDYVKTKAEYES